MNTNKKIYIGSDHAGYFTKKSIVKWLNVNGYEVIDLGTHTCESTDYPDYAFIVAESVVKEQVRGILVCGTGVGICIAANKVKGARAALVYDPKLAALAVTHDDANILCLSGRYVSDGKNFKIIQNFLKAEFEGGRHLKRINKIKKFESKN